MGKNKSNRTTLLCVNYRMLMLTISECWSRHLEEVAVVAARSEGIAVPIDAATDDASAPRPASVPAPKSAVRTIDFK